MDFRNAFIYIDVNIFCFVVTAIILSKFSLNVGSEKDIIIFRKMVASYMVFLITETIWAFGFDNLIPIPPLVYGLAKAFGTFFIPLMVYNWFLFALNRFKIDINNKAVKVIALLPLILLFILYVTSFFTGLVFKITPNNTIEYGPAYAASGIVDNIYGILIVVIAIVSLISKRNKASRSTYFIQIMFIVMCTVGGIIDAVVSNTPTMPLAICLSFIYLFISIQEPHIYNDSLTGLNNRRRTDMFMNDILNGGERNWHLFIMDIDDFKNVNDNLGHMVGDTAIKLVADSIAQVVSEYKKAFCSRWGGDEFVVIIQDDRDDFTDELKNKIEECIVDNSTKYDIDFPLHLSVGHAKHEPNKKSTLKELIERADGALYVAKQSKNVR